MAPALTLIYVSLHEISLDFAVFLKALTNLNKTCYFFYFVEMDY